MKSLLYKEHFDDLMLFDTLIYNTDRHLGNFGMIIDNNTNKFLCPAPIFDNGLSFIAMLEEENLSNINKSISYMQSFFGISFDEQMQHSIQERHLENLHKLSTLNLLNTLHLIYLL